MRRLSLMTAVLAVLLFPLSAAADPPEVWIQGQGEVTINVGEFDSEDIRFSVTAKGGEPLPTEEIPANGQIQLRTVEPFDIDWHLHGSVVCIRDLSLFDPVAFEGVWIVRYQATQSTHPEISVGDYAAFYVKDDPSGDMAGELSDPNVFDDPNCGPRGGIQLRPLLTGHTTVRTP